MPFVKCKCCGMNINLKSHYNTCGVCDESIHYHNDSLKLSKPAHVKTKKLLSRVPSFSPSQFDLTNSFTCRDFDYKQKARCKQSNDTITYYARSGYCFGRIDSRIFERVKESEITNIMEWIENCDKKLTKI